MKVLTIKPQNYFLNIIKLEVMKKLFAILLSYILVGSLISCKQKETPLVFKFIQLNDVYEIAPLSGGTYGGMARVAYVRDSIAKENPNTFMFMAGDFLNPSLLGTIKVNGERLKGKQMVEVMNAMNFNLVTFGNHEFDLKENELQQRLNESTFPWVSSNVRHITKTDTIPFQIQKPSDTTFVPDTFTFTIKDKNNNQISIGFLAITIPANPKPYVFYGDIYQEAKRAYNNLKQNVDFVMGLTHLEIEQDQELARQLPEMPFIMGGHEHNAMLVKAGATTITKADANAKTIYIHTFTYYPKTKELKRDSELFFIDEKVPSNTKVKAIVGKWTSLLDEKIKEIIKDPNEVIYTAASPLDGTDSASRSIQTNLGDIITEAMAWAYNNKVDAALVNGGSIRVDDMLPAAITPMDIFRALPFGGGVLKVDLKGNLLKEVLDYGESKKGEGAYLQRYNITQNQQGNWVIGGKPINPNKIYTVAFSDYLLKGYDIPFLTPNNKSVIQVYHPKETEPAHDIRSAIILYLKQKNN